MGIILPNPPLYNRPNAIPIPYPFNVANTVSQENEEKLFMTYENKRNHIKERLKIAEENPSRHDLVDLRFDEFYNQSLKKHRPQFLKLYRDENKKKEFNELLEVFELEVGAELAKTVYGTVAWYNNIEEEIVHDKAENDSFFSQEFWLSGAKRHQKVWDLPKVKDDLKYIYQRTIRAKTDDKIKEFQICELLSKEYAQCISMIGDQKEIRLPFKIKTANEELQVYYMDYIVEEIPIFLGMYAYGLTPKNSDTAQPILLFSGTKPYPSGLASGATIVSNLDPFGVGFIAYWWGEKNLKAWLEKATFGGRRKVLGCGYSLGGALLTNTVVYQSQYFSKAYTYNSPGTGYLVKKHWKLKPRSEKILNFDDHEDSISRLGQEKIGENFKVCVHKTEPRGMIAAHGAIHYRKSYSITEDKDYKRFWFLPVWLQVSVLPFFYFPLLAALLAKRLILGHYRAKPWTYLTGPVEWTICKIIAIWERISDRFNEWASRAIPRRMETFSANYFQQILQQGNLEALL